MYVCIERLLQRDCRVLGDGVYVERAPWPVSLDFVSLNCINFK